jgi:hypothetical protein
MLALAVAFPAAAYILPVRAILRHMSERRAALSLASLDVAGTLQAEGQAAASLSAATGLEAVGGRFAAPARFQMKVPGRCRLEIAPLDSAEADRPYVAVRAEIVAGQGGLPESPAAIALVRSACALLATQTAGDAAGAYAAALARRGVGVSQAALGRFDGRIAYVIGGRGKESKPVVYVEKDGFQPMRLVTSEGGALQDVRLLGWGSPTGGDWFPRAVEVWEKDVLQLRFTTEKTSANAKLADALFP